MINLHSQYEVDYPLVHFYEQTMGFLTITFNKAKEHLFKVSTIQVGSTSMALKKAQAETNSSTFKGLGVSKTFFSWKHHSPM